MSDTSYPVYQHYGTASQRASFTPVPPATGQPIYIWYETDTGVTYLYDTAWHAISSGGSNARPAGRLTLTTAVPFLVTSVTGATTIYYTPAEGNIVPIYNGTTFAPTPFSELSQTTADTTKSPAAVANNSNYDMFVWNDAGTLRCTRGPLWTSDTGRGTGAGTTELVRTSGILLNAVNITNGPLASRGTYVGTVRSNGSAQIDFIVGTQAGGAGGEGTILGLWNMYNRRLINLTNFDNTDSWNYTTATYRLKNAGASTELNKIKMIIGLQGDGVSAINTAVASNSTAGVTAQISIGLNSTATPSGSVGAGRSPNANNGFSLAAVYSFAAPLGFNYLAPLEFSNASGTQTWFGDGGLASQPQGLFTAQTMY